MASALVHITVCFLTHKPAIGAEIGSVFIGLLQRIPDPINRVVGKRPKLTSTGFNNEVVLGVADDAMKGTLVAPLNMDLAKATRCGAVIRLEPVAPVAPCSFASESLGRFAFRDSLLPVPRFAEV